MGQCQVKYVKISEKKSPGQWKWY